MKFIAAHKVMFMVGLVLAGGVAWYLHRKASSTAAQGASAPDYGGVATDPYNDSAAPQFSFDLGSLLPNGPAGPALDPTQTTTSTPTTPPPRRVDVPVPPTLTPTPTPGGITTVPEQQGTPTGVGTRASVSLPLKTYIGQSELIPMGESSVKTPLAIQVTPSGQEFQIGGGGKRSY